MLHAEFDHCLSSLDERSWHRVARGARRALNSVHLRKEERNSSFSIKGLAGEVSHRTIAALMIRADRATAHSLYEKYLIDVVTDDQIVLEGIQAEALDVGRIGSSEWSPDLVRIKQCYAAGALEPYIPFSRMGEQGSSLPLPIARAIAGEPTSFPGALVGLAEETCHREVARKAVAVADVAERQGWFGQPFKQSLFDI